MKRTYIIILIAAITTLSLLASEDNETASINGITIQTEAGELAATLISQGYNPREISHLTIKGTLDEQDFSFMRENLPCLHHLNISGITNSTLPTTVFANNATLSTVILPEGLTIIPSEAFKNSRIQSIIIPSRVNTIGDYAFQNCTFLTSVILPVEINSIGTYAFENCNSLSSISICSIISYGAYSFDNCTALEKVIYAGSLSDWCNQTFTNLTSNPLYYAHNLYINNECIEKLYIPEDIVRIEKNTFAGLSCRSVVIPNTTTSIGSNAFYNCNLQDIYIGNHIKYIEYNAFELCTDLRNITCSAVVPPLSNQTLTSINPQTCKLHVPKEALINYYQSAIWSPFLYQVK